MRIRSGLSRWSLGAVVVLLVVSAASAQTSSISVKPVVDTSIGSIKTLQPKFWHTVFDPGPFEIKEQPFRPDQIKSIDAFRGPEGSLTAPLSGDSLSTGMSKDGSAVSLGSSMTILSSSGADRGARVVTPADVLGELEKLREALGL